MKQRNKTGCRDIPAARLVLPHPNVSTFTQSGPLQFVNAPYAEFNGRVVHRTYL
jgi:hypothetical protein